MDMFKRLANATKGLSGRNSRSSGSSGGAENLAAGGSGSAGAQSATVEVLNRLDESVDLMLVVGDANPQLIGTLAKDQKTSHAVPNGGRIEIAPKSADNLSTGRMGTA